MNYFDVDTPAVLIDMAVTGSNIKNYQKYCDENGLNLRPHIKLLKDQIQYTKKIFGFVVESGNIVSPKVF